MNLYDPDPCYTARLLEAPIAVHFARAWDPFRLLVALVSVFRCDELKRLSKENIAPLALYCCSE